MESSSFPWGNGAVPHQIQRPDDKAAIDLLNYVRDTCTLTGASFLAVALISRYDHLVYTAGGSCAFGGQRAQALRDRLLRCVPSERRAEAAAKAGLYALPVSAKSFQLTKKIRTATWQRRCSKSAGYTPQLGDARVWVFVSHAVDAAQHVVDCASPAAVAHLPSEVWSQIAQAVNGTAG